jgi:hypothetical protein
MDNKSLAIFIIVIVILSGVLGVIVGRKTAPEVVIGAETTLITVTVSDTVVVEKIARDIQIVTRVVHDTLIIENDVSQVVRDSTTCYEFSEVMADSAFVKCGVCADSLPEDLPDLSGSITYVPPPRTTREIFRVDTINVTRTAHDWRWYMGVAAAGLLVGIVSNR